MLSVKFYFLNPESKTNNLRNYLAIYYLKAQKQKLKFNKLSRHLEPQLTHSCQPFASCNQGGFAQQSVRYIELHST